MSFIPILISTGKDIDKVESIIFDVSLEELELAVKYEVADYKRISVILYSGVSAWVYVSVANG